MIEHESIPVYARIYKKDDYHYGFTFYTEQHALYTEPPVHRDKTDAENMAMDIAAIKQYEITWKY
jgi:hypothetical protein